MSFSEGLSYAIAFQAVFLFTIGYLVVTFFATTVVAPEIRNRSIFVLFERPVKREYILLHKFIVGAVETIICVGTSPFILSIVAYVLHLILPDEKVTPTFQELLNSFEISLRAGIWVSVSCLVVFAMAFLLSILFEKQSLAAIASAVILITFKTGHYRFANFKEAFLRYPAYDGSAGSPNLRPLDPSTIFVMILIAIALYLIAQYVFVHKEVK